MSTNTTPVITPIISDVPLDHHEYEVPEGSPHPHLSYPPDTSEQPFTAKGYVHGQTEGTGDHHVTIHDTNTTHDPHYTQPIKQHVAITSYEPFFIYPVIVGCLLFGAWFITNLVLESGDALAPWNDGVTVFVIQMSTFGIAVCLGWYAMNDNTDKYYVLCAVYNYIMVCMYLLHLVEMGGFFQWKSNKSFTLTACFPNAFDGKICDAFKAATIFSFFIMLIHFIWMLGYGMKAISEVKFTKDSHGLLLIMNGINMFSFFLWWTGVIGVADQQGAVVSGGEMEYILILCITACTLLSFAYILTPTSNTILSLAFIWHWITCLMLWSTTLMIARTSDNSSKVTLAAMATSGGRAVAATGILFLLTHTVSALTFTLKKFGILN